MLQQVRRRHYVFRLSVRECVRAWFRVCIPLARYLIIHWTEFHQTLVTGVVEATDELIRFCRSMGQVQGRYKVRYLTMSVSC